MPEPCAAQAMPHPDGEDRVFVFWRPDHIGGVAKAPELDGEPAAADWNRPPSCCGCAGLLVKLVLAGAAALEAGSEAAGEAAAHGKVGAAWLAACGTAQLGVSTLAPQPDAYPTACQILPEGIL